MKEMTKEELFALFDQSVHGLLKAALKRPDTEGLLVFENQQMDSSSFGRRSAVRFGPNCTYINPSSAEGKWLYGLPSQRQYLIGFHRKPVGLSPEPAKV